METHKDFLVILTGQHPDGSGIYRAKKTIEVRTDLARIISEHDSFEEAAEGASIAHLSEQRFVVRSKK